MFRLLTASLLFGSMAIAQPAGFTCPVTPASSSFGTPKLSVSVTPGPWSGLPLWSSGYRQKIVWFTEGYVFSQSPEPQLTITGQRLDGDAPPLVSDGSHGSRTQDLGNFIMSGVNFPSTGCWKITGHLDGAELSYVVKVGQ